MVKQGKGLQAHFLEETEYVSSTDAQTASENPTTPPLPSLQQLFFLFIKLHMHPEDFDF